MKKKSRALKHGFVSLTWNIFPISIIFTITIYKPHESLKKSFQRNQNSRRKSKYIYCLWWNEIDENTFTQQNKKIKWCEEKKIKLFTRRFIDSIRCVGMKMEKGSRNNKFPYQKSTDDNDISICHVLCSDWVCFRYHVCVAYTTNTIFLFFIIIILWANTSRVWSIDTYTFRMKCCKMSIHFKVPKSPYIEIRNPSRIHWWCKR